MTVGDQSFHSCNFRVMDCSYTPYKVHVHHGIPRTSKWHCFLFKGETRNKDKDKIKNKRRTRTLGECLGCYTQKPERKGQESMIFLLKLRTSKANCTCEIMEDANES